MMFSRRKGGRILVVEDDWDILEVLKFMLEDEGHQVVTAKHGAAALAAARARPFDLAVMDISMPEMSGIDVARALRAEPATADIRIVIHTGLEERWVRERFDDYDAFLTKAEDADRLVTQIARLLASPRAPRERGPAAPAASTFSRDELAKARAALRAAMALGDERLALEPFLAQLAGEIGQLRRLGRSDLEIAALLTDALGRSFDPAALGAVGEQEAGDTIRP